MRTKKGGQINWRHAVSTWLPCLARNKVHAPQFYQTKCIRRTLMGLFSVLSITTCNSALMIYHLQKSNHAISGIPTVRYAVSDTVSLPVPSLSAC